MRRTSSSYHSTICTQSVSSLGVSLGSQSGGYLAQGGLESYWRELTGSAAVVAIVGGAAGAILVMANRPVLTAGVMIALALVPGAALMGIAVAEADLGLAVDGAVAGRTTQSL